MQRVWFAAIDDMGHEIKVTQDIDVGTVPVIIAIDYPPTMEEYEKGAPSRILRFSRQGKRGSSRRKSRSADETECRWVGAD